MSIILHIETATSVCSVALSDKDHVLAFRESREGKNHSLLLTSFIEELLKETGTDASMLSAVAVSRGPGSYTGLRIGVSTAKGISYGRSIPLISLGTLSVMASGYVDESGISHENRDILLCPMIDARRMEVYTAVYYSDGTVFRDVAALIVDSQTFAAEMENHRMIFFGDGAAKCTKVLAHQNATIDEEFFISAKFMAIPAWKKFREKRFENVAYFEPFYLKDFIATVPGNKML